MDKLGYSRLPPAERKFDALIEKTIRGVPLDNEELEYLTLDHLGIVKAMQRIRVQVLPPQRCVWLKRFYIARYRITETQYRSFREGTPAIELPGALEEPSSYWHESTHPKKKTLFFGQIAAQVRQDESLRLCEQLGARLPTEDEWKRLRAARTGGYIPGVMSGI